METVKKISGRQGLGARGESAQRTFRAVRLICLVPLTGFPGDSDDKESVCHEGDPGSIPGWDRCPGEANGYPL